MSSAKTDFPFRMWRTPSPTWLHVKVIPEVKHNSVVSGFGYQVINARDNFVALSTVWTTLELWLEKFLQLRDHFRFDVIEAALQHIEYVQITHGSLSRMVTTNVPDASTLALARTIADGTGTSKVWTSPRYSGSFGQMSTTLPGR